MFAVGAALLVTTIVFRRWRHLFTFLGSVLVVRGRRRAADRRVRAARAPTTSRPSAAGRASRCPSATAAIVSFTVVGIIYMLVVPGGRERIAKAVGAVVVGVVVAARLYLAVDHPVRRPRRRRARRRRSRCSRSGSSPPTRSFPVTLPRRQDRPPRHRRTARRGAPRAPSRTSSASRVVDVQPVGLAGSGGSTPLRLRLAGDPDTYVFGKLYAMNHVRADRWYKTGPHDPLRAARGRGAVPVRAPARPVRGLRAARRCATPGSRRPRRSASSS